MPNKRLSEIDKQELRKIEGQVVKILAEVQKLDAQKKSLKKRENELLTQYSEIRGEDVQDPDDEGDGKNGDPK